MTAKLIHCFTLLVLLSCDRGQEVKNLTYQNLVIIPDMSSRLTNKPSKDIAKITEIVQDFKNKCVMPGKKIGDRSSIFFSPFSSKVIASIDLDTLKNLGEKQSFINSSGKFKNNGLNQRIKHFKDEVKLTYINTQNQGLDLISILMEKIENEPIIKMDTIFNDDINTTSIKYDNHLYILTDGYLEYHNKKQNDQFYFSSSEIDKVRQFCKTNNVEISKALEMNRSLCLPPYKTNKNKFIHLHILETHERDKNDKLQSYSHPKGLRDNEILQAVWKKWAIESGFKNFEWKKY